MTPQQALEQLLNGARMARLTYAEHAVCDQCGQLLEKFIADHAKPAPTPAEKPEKTPEVAVGFDHGKKS